MTHGPQSYLEFLFRLLSASLNVIPPTASTALSLLYMYTILQLVGLLWAFVTNALLSLGLMAAREISTFGAALGAMKKREIVATFYVIYSTLRVVLRFLSASSIVVWQSLNDFPKPRRAMQRHIKGKERMIIVAVTMPVLVLSLLLIATGSACEHDNMVSAKLSHFISTLPPAQESTGETVAKYFCADSPFSYITPGYSLPRRILTLILVFCILQCALTVANLWPSWRQVLSTRTVAAATFDASSLVLIAATLFFALDAAYTFVTTAEIFRDLQTVLTPVGIETLYSLEDLTTLSSTIVSRTIDEAIASVSSTSNRSSYFIPEQAAFEHLVLGGQVLLLFWLLHITALALTLSSLKPPTPTSASTRPLFNAFKNTFLFYVWALFVLGCAHPDFGFIDAQIDLTLLTIGIPAMQVTLGICAYNALQSTRFVFLLGIPVSVALAALSVVHSRAGGPGSFFIVTLHVFTKFMQIFGNDIDSKVDASSTISTATSASKELRRLQQTSAVGIDDFMPDDEGEGAREAQPQTRARQFTWFGVNVSKSFREIPQDKKPEDEATTRASRDFSFGSAIEEGEEDGGDEEEDETFLGDEENDEFDEMAVQTPPRTSSATKVPGKTRTERGNTAQVAAAIPQNLKDAIIKKHTERQQRLKKLRSFKSQSYAIAPRNMYSSLARFSTAFAVTVALIVGFIAVASFLQNEKQWYPDLIDINKSESTGSVSISHAYVAHLKLETQGPVKTQAPKYGSCGMKWYGLSLLDYALLAEAAYFDPDNSDLNSVVGMMFDPLGVEKEPLFEVRVPPPEERRAGVAQFMDAYSKSLNVSVIAIRGTDVGRMSDIIEDVKIFKEPVLLSILSVFFPTIRIWPDSVAAFVIHALHKTLSIFGLGSSADYYKGVLDYVKGIDDRQVVLTGHSLGGGLARIVAAVSHVPNIAFSPPGVAQSFYKFVYNEMESSSDLSNAAKLLHHESVAVLPENDPVPTVDTQVGLIQRISCDVSAQALQNACHMLEGTIVNLLRSCGDDRGRFKAGDFRFTVADILKQTYAKSLEHKSTVLAGAAMVLIVLLLIVLEL